MVIKTLASLPWISIISRPFPTQLTHPIYNMKRVALASLLVLYFANSSSSRSLSALVLHRNGALVPADTPAVAAARDLHLQALAALSAPEPPRMGGR